MDMKPRNLSVFAAPNLQTTQKQEKAGITERKQEFIARNAYDYQTASTKVTPVQMLGHSMRAVPLPKGESLTYTFVTETDGDAVLKVALIPTQPNDKGDLRFSVSVDGAKPTLFSLKEPFRSESWKLNVLRGQAVRDLKLDGLKQGKHTLVRISSQLCQVQRK